MGNLLALKQKDAEPTAKSRNNTIWIGEFSGFERAYESHLHPMLSLAPFQGAQATDR